MIGKYQKMKRIAFGEYVPFVSDIPMLNSWVEEFFGSFLNEMRQWKSHQVFSSDLKRSLNIIPLICYETMFPEFVAKAVSEALTTVPSADLLVGLSSDGWFGLTHQPYQHVNSSILRAVENRLPLVHVLNNGPSIVAMPNGKVVFKTDANQAGGYLVDVPYGKDSEGSFFSHYTLLFIYSVYSLMLFIILCALRREQQV
jgi:apolipoprotein N-acyltransferase